MPTWSRPVRRALGSVARGTVGLLVLGLVGAGPTTAAPPRPPLTPTIVGEAPRAGGVVRFPQAVGVDPRNGDVVVGDQYSGTIQTFGPTGTPKRSFGGYAHRGEPGRFDVVGGLALDRSGRIFVLDSAHDRIQVISADDGRFITTIGGPSTLKLLNGSRPDRGIIAGGIAVHQAAPGRTVVVFVADSGNHRVVRWALDPVTLKPYTSPRVTSRAGGVNLQYPQGLGVSPDGRRLYVADNQHHRILVLGSRSLQVVGRAGRHGTGPGEINAPYDVAVDRKDRFYIADNLNGRLNIHDTETLDYVGTAGGRGRTVGRFAIVRAVATDPTDPEGGAIVADTSNNRIQRVRPDGTVWAAWGIAGRGPGYFTRPRGVAVHPDGTLAVADTFDHRVALIASDGTYVDQRAYISRSTGFAHWGRERRAQMLLPGAVAWDRAGGLWVADTYNNRLQRLAPDGVPVLVTPPGFVKRPRGIAAHPDGSVWVADTNNGRVLRVDIGGNATTIRSGLGRPYAVTVSPTGQAYVTTTRSIRDVATNEKVPPPPGATRWDRPEGLAAAADGTLYVAEARPKVPGGARILRGVPHVDGRWTWDVLASEAGPGTTVVEPGTLALAPGDGTLYVADAGQDRILRFDKPGIRAPTTVPLGVTLEGGGPLRGTVTSQPPGIDCGTDCGQSFAPTRTVTLTARPHADSRFTGWGGACAGATNGPTCTIAMGQARHVTARFDALPPDPVRIRTASVTPRRWHLRRKSGPRSRRAATKARLTIRVTEESRVRVQVAHARAGRKTAKGCRKAPKGRRVSRRKACTRFAVLPVKRDLELVEGRTRIDAGPRFGRRTLTPGRYRLVVTATNETGEHRRHTRSFRVTR
ncbi:MAG: NHL repeat-containing protein [Solirubrobacteraceae bacterium]|nr:NHL repeat-containing protein [Solirubrobacteraceae bacterium]